MAVSAKASKPEKPQPARPGSLSLHEQRLEAQDGCPHSSGDSTPFEMRFPPLTKRSTQLVQRQ